MYVWSSSCMPYVVALHVACGNIAWCAADLHLICNAVEG